MPSLKTTELASAELRHALGDEGQVEYGQLQRMVKATRGSHFILFVESDFPPALRNVLIGRLREDLMESGLCLRCLVLSREHWDLSWLLEDEPPITPSDVVVLIGLEETPGIVPEAGRPLSRPPALARLNIAREALRVQLPVPLLVWCPPHVMTALQLNAPDFFDHYTGLFQFLNAAPETPVKTHTGTKTIEGEGHFVGSGTLGSAPTILTLTNTKTVEDEDHASEQIHIARSSDLEFYEQQVAKYTEPTPERARALLGLATAVWSNDASNFAERLIRSRLVAEEALAILSREQNAYDWARAHNLLGTIAASLPAGDRTQNLYEAIAHFEAALQVYTEETFSADWAMTQHNLGTSYLNLTAHDRAQNLQRAIACFGAALRVRTEQEFPTEWALTQNNLGAAYLKLPTGDRTANLQRAIACYEAALRVYTEAAFPIDWARAQNNLGAVYADLQTGDRAANLRRAITCFEAALRVYTEHEVPAPWAKAQANLGAAYYDLPTGDRTANLRRAVSCYEAALRVYAEQSLPEGWARTQFNLALALEDNGDREAARQAMQRAAEGYRSIGMKQETREAEEWLQRRAGISNAI